MTDRVLASERAKSAAQRMRQVVEADVRPAVQQLRQQGQVLSDPAAWDGPRAAEFRAWWRTRGLALESLLLSLDRLQTAAASALADIIRAGSASNLGGLAQGTGGQPVLTDSAAHSPPASSSPPWYDRIGHWFAHGASDVGGALTQFGEQTLNFLGYAATHPIDDLKLVGDAGLTALGVLGMVAGAGGEGAGLVLTFTGVGTVPGLAIDAGSAALAAAGAATAGAGAALGLGQLGNMWAQAQEGSGGSGSGSSGGGEPGDEEPVAGLPYTADELAQFAYQHAGEGDLAGRPSLEEIQRALTSVQGKPIVGQNAVQFDYRGVRVIINRDIPWRSTAFKVGS